MHNPLGQAMREPANGAVVAGMVDIAYALQAHDGGALPRDHRELLARALEAALPWLAEEGAGARPAAGVHRLNLAGDDGAQALLSRRTRLVLRVTRERVPDALALQGVTLRLEHACLTVGAAQVRELLPWATLYAHCVAVPEGQAEAAFLQDVARGLHALQAQGRAICGRAQQLERGALHGYSLMVDGLAADAALRLMEHGLGAHRRLGCGLFVPHKSAAAVGTPI